MNPVLKATAKLLTEVRKADSETLRDAESALQRFANAWLVSGDGQNLPSAGDCCLADTDITEAIKEAIAIQADNRD